MVAGFVRTVDLRYVAIITYNDQFVMLTTTEVLNDRSINIRGAYRNDKQRPF